MNALIPKKPKEYKDLSPRQQERIQEYIVELVKEATLKQVIAECKSWLETDLKRSCCILYDCFGFREKRLNYFLANHRRVCNRENKLVTRGELTEYLDKRMAEIFPKNGFPQEFIDSIIGEIEFVDVSEIEEVE